MARVLHASAFKDVHCVFKVILHSSSFRVEGRGSAVITDVIYSSETSSEEEKPSSQTKEKYESIKVIQQVQNWRVLILCIHQFRFCIH